MLIRSLVRFNLFQGMSSPLHMDDESVPLWKPSKMIHQGAEATVFSGFWMGEKASLRSKALFRGPEGDLDIKP